MGAMMARASWSFWHVKEKIDFKKAGIQSSRLSPSSLTIADLQGFDFRLRVRRRCFHADVVEHQLHWPAAVRGRRRSAKRTRRH